LVKPINLNKNKNNKRRPKCGAWRQNGGGLGDVTEAERPILQGLEVILQILKLGGHFCRDHCTSAPPPSYHRHTLVSYVNLTIEIN